MRLALTEQLQGRNRWQAHPEEADMCMPICLGDILFAISFTHHETPSQLLDQCHCHKTEMNDKIRRGYITPTVKDTKDTRDKTAKGNKSLALVCSGFFCNYLV